MSRPVKCEQGKTASGPHEAVCRPCAFPLRASRIFARPVAVPFTDCERAEAGAECRGMAVTAHLTCAFPDRALSVADKLGDIARSYGLAAWTTARSEGEWQIRIEGDEQELRRFAADVGIKPFEAARDS